MDHQRLTDDHKQRFLALLRTTGNPSVAARGIGFSPSTLKRHRDADEEFATEWLEAQDEAADALEEEARRRAVEGVVREKWVGPADGGHFINEVSYSDTLLLALLKAKKPREYAQLSRTEVSGPEGADLPALDETALAARLASILALADARASGAKE